jgi:16S rRNA (guanine966-N2)-methyltransferase
VTRIIAGSAGGRRLRTPPGQDTRPTSDRVREALFSALEARGVLRGARVLDLFAGSGALGLEAASRGAAEVVLVDSSAQAVAAARANVAVVGAAGVAVVRSPVLRHLRERGTGADRPVDLVLMDPPYPLAEPDLALCLAALLDAGWLAPGALVVVERSARSPEPAWPAGLEREQVRRYGETAVWTAVPTDVPTDRPVTAQAGPDGEPTTDG